MRLGPLDAAAAAGALLATATMLAWMPIHGRPATDPRSAAAAVELELRTLGPVAAEVARELAPGRLPVQTRRGSQTLVVIGREPAPAGGVRLRLRLVAERDPAGRLAWNGQPLQVGRRLGFGDRERWLSAEIARLAPLEPPR